MLISEFSELFAETRSYGIKDNVTEELIDDFESEYGYSPRNYEELLEVVE
jgi:hypothetical protein